MPTSPAGTGKSTAEMHQQATFVGWDFVNTWSIDEGNDYPRLRSANPPAPPGETDCGNAFDDDCDSFVDCADSDCAANLACLPAGVPADSDCAANLACLPAGVPADSTWGLTVMTLLTLTAATILLQRRA